MDQFKRLPWANKGLLQMSRIVITSAGTFGDFLPFVALGQALKARGHEVRMAINAAMHPLGRKAGLPCLPCGEAFGPEEARARAEVFDYWHRIPLSRCLHYYQLLNLPRTVRELAAACQGADLLIASNVQGTAHLVAEKTGIPWLSVSLLPLEFMAQQEKFASTPATTPGAARVIRIWRRLANELRVSLGLVPHALEHWPTPRKPDRLLLAYSRYFNRTRRTARPPMRQTGFWFYDGDAAGPREPSPGLRTFVEKDAPPLVLSLSSQPVRNPEHVLAVHAEAAGRLGLRLVVQCGWAGFEARRLPARIDRRRVFFSDYLPHDWLFPRAAALIHHGGVGTTARALRQGLPMLVEPYGNDQFHNAYRILALGVGAAAHPHKLTSEGLCRLLDEKVLTPDARRNAEVLGAKIRAEDSVSMACDLIEKRIRGEPWD
jgi:UDP:flavonoid glycosyltransferase YjiC (YdhE family)